MRNVSDETCRENENTHFMFSNFFWKLCLLYNYVGEYDRARQAIDDNIKRCMHCACWIPYATETHLEYVILTAFPQQQWLHERASMLRYAWIACLVYNWLHCPALTGHRLKCFGFVWLDPTDIARFSIKVALTMAWRTSRFFVRPWNVFEGQHIEIQNEPGVWGNGRLFFLFHTKV